MFPGTGPRTWNLSRQTRRRLIWRGVPHSWGSRVPLYRWVSDVGRTSMIHGSWDLNGLKYRDSSEDSWSVWRRGPGWKDYSTPTSDLYLNPIGERTWVPGTPYSTSTLTFPFLHRGFTLSRLGRYKVVFVGGLRRFLSVKSRPEGLSVLQDEQFHLPSWHKIKLSKDRNKCVNFISMHTFIRRDNQNETRGV